MTTHNDELPKFTLAEVVAFLTGESQMDGIWFGEQHPTERGNYWWRKHLRAAVNQPAASILSEALEFVKEFVEAWDEGMAGDTALFRKAQAILKSSSLAEPAQAAMPDCVDTNVQANIDLLRNRSEVGLEKYGTATDKAGLSVLEWHDHAILEFLDGANYLQAAKRQWLTLLSAINDDSLAMSFQSMAQYRSHLLKLAAPNAPAQSGEEK